MVYINHFAKIPVCMILSFNLMFFLLYEFLSSVNTAVTANNNNVDICGLLQITMILLMYLDLLYAVNYYMFVDRREATFSPQQ